MSPPVEAQGGVWLLPLPDKALGNVVGRPVGQAIAGFEHLFPELPEKLESASEQGWIVYAETEYFGGAGAQGAVALKNGAICHGPEHGESGCINRALSSVGIKTVPPARDEFETVGLNLHRTTDDWNRERPR